MMFGGYETIEAYEDDLYREESSSELSVDSEVEFQLYSQVHYAQHLDNVIKEEEHEEKNSGNSESSISKPNQKNLIILSDSEVIQLSDGSEVITLSDEDSIYRCKRKNFRVQAKEKTQGPPASFHSNKLTDKKCKRNIEKPKSEELSGTIREVMIIEVSSSEEEESTISESDNVENWMLLGCEVDDKDDDILLNLVGCENSVNEGEDGVNWFISDKDAEAQIVNNRSSGRWTHRYYSANKNVTCRNCDKCGHLSKNCPFPQKVRPCCLCSERGHLQYACPARFCLGCSLPMPSTHRCLERPSWRKRCDRCDMIGHYADACPEIWRQYHLTTKPGPPKKPKTPSGQSALVYCYNCGQEGHYGHECTERRMFNQTFPTSPFIYYYDDKYEIREREQRIKRKVKELQKNGDFPRQFKRPHMEAAEKRPPHGRRKSHASWRNSRWPQEKKETQKEASRSRKEREKHRKADRAHEVEEDFPRGPKLHSPGTFKTQKGPKSFHHSSHYHKPREDKLPRDSKRGKQKKKESYLEGDGSDNLFLIKQRKKKSKL
ncbi:zinc finger CCHC domain-containing protein 7 [Panthera pardus]|uniref:Zinc finger CCHC domain-containing protein 7 n=2 Tax=Panthera TaxID=9688 RepID=A0A8C8X5A0_PANLE|nr:zinc finger CCHC domain-containing protein 7 [Panthera pardus]XP_019310021.2 zinc finger CCHC domain-containing protein 7 [Panthera pardus]XP_019310022.2 zinc finger CCHC domain-containing protein 7 [Panthera pardus]XP_042768517.1 zinc finger CCHC domain-containing protein 7 [Panthera leo]XP_042768518.1 zinc finger CCHC domain-containing protein 7 [Panthera leo]XP_042768519.1 zinc finger CCHC domain-containing protein 7 [Panthera leo]XP_042768520.1 zinc finger CCHC domain-containing protei